MKIIFIFLAAAAFMVLFPAGIVTAIIIALNSGKNRPQQYVNTPYAYQSGMVQPPKPRKKMTASAIILLIGTAFIVLSAITFVAANWVKMEPAGRVFALAGAAVLAFGISGIMKATVGLERTSAAFYIMGTLIITVSLITAGYYELFGEWFCITGDGAQLLKAMLMAVIAAACFIAYPIYKKAAFHYMGFSFISVALAFVCLQLTDEFKQTAVALAFAQLVITAVLHIFKPHKGTIVEKPMGLIGDITAIIYEIAAMGYVLESSFDTTAYSFAVIAILLVQFFLYGVFKGQKWMFIFFNILSVYTAFIAVCKAENEFGESFVMIFFAMITMVIYLINRFVPKNLAASQVITFIAAIIGAGVSLSAVNDRLFWVDLIVPAVMSLAVISYCFHKSRNIQIAAGLFSPVLPFLMALFLNDRLYYRFCAGVGGASHSEVETIAFGALVLVYMAVTAFVMYLPRINFAYHAKHPIQTQTVIYANMIAAAAVLMNITDYSTLFMVTAGLCVLHFILSYMMSCNITAIGSSVTLVILTTHILQHFFGEKSEGCMYLMFVLFVIIMGVSRLVFPESFIVKKESKTIIDVLLLSAWTAVIPFPSFNRVAIFLRLIALAVFLAGFIKKNTNKDVSAVILSVSAFLTAVAFISRPFLNPDSSMISSKITLGIIVLLGIAYKYIWKNHKEASRLVSTLIFVISFAGLIIDGLIYSSVFNKIFVLTVTAGILIISFYAKSKTWFIASSLALVIMTIVYTKKYFDTAGWWIYLLVIGIIFVVIATINEACKKKGETVKSTVVKQFSDWTW